LQALAVLFGALALTASVWLIVHREAERVAEAEFAEIADDMVAGMAKRMEDYAQILRGGVAYLQASRQVTRQEWRDFVAGLRVDDHYPGIQGIGYAVHVAPDAVPAHEAAVRAEGFPDYAVTPEGPREDYYPILFLEPFDWRNRRAFGYDMFSEPTRREAMRRARDTGAPALSGKVILVQETDQDVQAGALLYLPFYDPQAELGGEAARREAILGFVYSPFRMADLMNGIFGGRLDEVRVTLYDGGGFGDNLLFRSAQRPMGEYRRHRQVEIFGRPWLVDIESTPVLDQTLDQNASGIVLVAGAIISLLLAWLAHSLFSERGKRTALAQANRQLAAARLAAEAADRAKSKFLAAASHDIRQPVQSIMLLTAALSQQVSDLPVQKLVKHLDTSLDALRMLLNGLLDVSKLDAGVVVPEVGDVEIEPLLAQLATEYRMLAEEKGLRLDDETCAAIVHTDRTLIERILRNLLENALRYTPSGRVVLRCRIHGTVARVDVEDTGIGISQDELATIFEEFYQVGNPERDRSQGLGLGLAIVQRLSRLLGHRIDVRSRLGQGSCFTINLPLVDRRTSTEAPQPIPNAAAGGSGLVLIIDDEMMLRESLRLLIEGWKFETVVAASGDEAVTMLDGRTPGFIIADYRLAGGAIGTEAVRLVHEAAGRQVPAVILTGDTAPERIAEVERSGFAILHKPVPPPELHRLLAEAAVSNAA